jgi:hypothetical protein
LTDFSFGLLSALVDYGRKPLEKISVPPTAEAFGGGRKKIFFQSVKKIPLFEPPSNNDV